jgi:hypothetical protein
MPTPRLWAMPIRSYFLVIGPALAAVLWWLGWYLEPRPPAAVATQPAPPASAGQPASARQPASAPRLVPTPAAVTTGQAAPQSAPELQLEPTKPAEATRQAAHQAPKQRKRKQVAQRRKDPYGAYAYGSPYPRAYPYPQAYGGYPQAYGSRYAGWQPFFGYGR